MKFFLSCLIKIVRFLFKITLFPFVVTIFFSQCIHNVFVIPHIFFVKYRTNKQTKNKMRWNFSLKNSLPTLFFIQSVVGRYSMRVSQYMMLIFYTILEYIVTTIKIIYIHTIYDSTKTI